MQVGIGAFVVNRKREVLVVQERFGPLKGSVSHTLSCSRSTSTSAETQDQSSTGFLGNAATCLSAFLHHHTTDHPICHLNGTSGMTTGSASLHNVLGANVCSTALCAAA